jgi:hypothetical protein
MLSAMGGIKMKKGTLFAIAILAAAISVLPHAAAAETVGIAGLDVEVQDDALITVDTTVTDADGWFSIAGLGAGDYTLLVSDPLSSLAATLEFTVPLEKVPAVIWGSVASDDTASASLLINADVIGEDEVGVFTVKMKTKWNSNYSHSNGKIKVELRGAMASAVSGVTLSSAQGSIVADSLKYGGGKVKADFTKSTAYQALIPPTAVRGDTIDVTITVETIAGPQTEPVTVRILGKK